MPKTSIASLPPFDLAYAVGRLIASGKTTAPEVLRLAAERVQRIAALEAELKALTHGGQVAVPATKAPAARLTKAPKPAPKVKRAAGKLRLSPKLRAFRKIQGQYAGYLRGFTGDVRERIRAINAEKGAAAALAEMRKLLRASSKAGAKKAAKPASRKLKITPQRKAQLKIQGTYMGLLRGLPVAEKARMKLLAAKSGMAAAVEVMKGKG